MATFNYQAAKQAGYTDDQIVAYLSKFPDAKIKTGMEQMAQANAKPNLLSSLLPLIGSIGGGIVGAPFGPMGLIAGSGIGGGLGELGGQVIGGEKISGRDILKEAGIGAAGGSLGVLLGGAAKAGRAAQTGENILTKTGTGVAGQPYASKALAKLTGRSIAPRATEIAETATALPGRTATAKLGSVSTTRQTLNKLLGKITGRALGKTEVSGAKLLGTVTDQAGMATDLTSGIGKTNLKFWGNKIINVSNVDDLSKLNEELLKKLAKVGIKSQQGQVLLAIQTPIGEALNTAAGTGDIFKVLSRLNAAEPIIQKQAASSWRGPMGITSQVPVRAGEVIRGGVGGTLKAAGRFAQTPVARVGAGQLGARALLGGGGTAQQYQPQTTGISPTTMGEYAPATTPTPKLNITAEQVALARLTLPKATADALEAAYNIVNKKSTQSAAEEFISKALSNIKALDNEKVLGFGPITGGIESAKIGIVGGAGTSSDVVALNQRYQMLKLNILRAYQGARISDADYALADKYVPKISDTDQTARTKLKVLYEILSTSETPPQNEMYYQTD
jgi:hypothetical protein